VWDEVRHPRDLRGRFADVAAAGNVADSVGPPHAGPPRAGIPVRGPEIARMSDMARWSPDPNRARISEQLRRVHQLHQAQMQTEQQRPPGRRNLAQETAGLDAGGPWRNRPTGEPWGTTRVCGYCGGLLRERSGGGWEHATDGERVRRSGPGDFVSDVHNRAGTRVGPSDVVELPNDADGRPLDVGDRVEGVVDTVLGEVTDMNNDGEVELRLSDGDTIWAASGAVRLVGPPAPDDSPPGQARPTGSLRYAVADLQDEAGDPGAPPQTLDAVQRLMARVREQHQLPHPAAAEVSVRPWMRESVPAAPREHQDPEYATFWRDPSDYPPEGRRTFARTPVDVGDEVTVELPYSEVNMHMRVAGQVRRVLVGSDHATILSDDGTPHSPPITHGEAGVYRSEMIASDPRSVVRGYGLYVREPEPANGQRPGPRRRRMRDTNDQDLRLGDLVTGVPGLGGDGPLGDRAVRGTIAEINADDTVTVITPSTHTGLGQRVRILASDLARHPDETLPLRTYADGAVRSHRRR
jgi:hypothetical protein